MAMQDYITNEQTSGSLIPRPPPRFYLAPILTAKGPISVHGTPDITGLVLEVASSTIFRKWEVGYTVNAFLESKKVRRHLCHSYSKL